MKKVILFIYALSISFSSFAQEEIITFNNYLKTSKAHIKEVIPIVNEQNQETSLFITDAKQAYGYLFDSNFKIIDEIVSDKRSRKYKTIIGSSIYNGNYTIFMTNKRRDKFASLLFSYENDNSNVAEIPLELKDEKFIQTVEYNNNFYILTIVRRTSKLNVYVFEKGSQFVKKEIDLSQDFEEKESLYNLLTISADGSYGLKKLVDINKIEEINPNAIEITSEKTKMYKRGSEIIFSFDENEDFTKVVTLSLDSFDYEVIEFDKPFKETHLKETNTFINGDNIYMVAATKKKFNFSIYSFETGNLIKEYNTTVDEVISFKNTPLIQIGGEFDSYRELEKTRKFLRKITNGNIGISVFKHNDTYEISIGGKQEVNSGGGMMMPMGMGLPMATFGAVTVFFNPAMFAYNSYSRTKSIQFKGLFDDNFNHLKGEIEKNAFDKIKDYEDENNLSSKGKSLFRFKDYYILGNYSPWPKEEYTLALFKD
ncbi:hypothetical protein [Aureibaculum luteum]|uniref:hypothetical protein n=1 Tax=Aureibaculum luteum TaxID=1548456 RepID=UPI000E53EE80|nr:hypothetical protein [Aureibaculum luteum]